MHLFEGIEDKLLSGLVRLIILASQQVGVHIDGHGHCAFEGIFFLQVPLIAVLPEDEAHEDEGRGGLEQVDAKVHPLISKFGTQKGEDDHNPSDRNDHTNGDRKLPPVEPPLQLCRTSVEFVAEIPVHAHAQVALDLVLVAKDGLAQLICGSEG